MRYEKYEIFEIGDMRYEIWETEVMRNMRYEKYEVWEIGDMRYEMRNTRYEK